MERCLTCILLYSWKASPTFSKVGNSPSLFSALLIQRFSSTWCSPAALGNSLYPFHSYQFYWHFLVSNFSSCDTGMSLRLSKEGCLNMSKGLESRSFISYFLLAVIIAQKSFKIQCLELICLLLIWFLYLYFYFFFVLLFLPALLRHNWHTALYKFKVSSIMIRLTYIKKCLP